MWPLPRVLKCLSGVLLIVGVIFLLIGAYLKTSRQNPDWQNKMIIGIQDERTAIFKDADFYPGDNVTFRAWSNVKVATLQGFRGVWSLRKQTRPLIIYGLTDGHPTVDYWLRGDEHGTMFFHYQEKIPVECSWQYQTRINSAGSSLVLSNIYNADSTCFAVGGCLTAIGVVLGAMFLHVRK